MSPQFVLREDPNAAPPDVGGQLTPWHRHDDLCFTPGGEVVGAAPACPSGSATYYTPWMLHVWLVPNRYGRFAADLDPLEPALDPALRMKVGEACPAR